MAGGESGPRLAGGGLRPPPARQTPLVELAQRRAAQGLEVAHTQKHTVLDGELKAAQLVGRAAQRADRATRLVGGKRGRERRLERRAALDDDLLAAGRQPQPGTLATAAVESRRERDRPRQRATGQRVGGEGIHLSGARAEYPVLDAHPLAQAQHEPLVAGPAAGQKRRQPGRLSRSPDGVDLHDIGLVEVADDTHRHLSPGLVDGLDPADLDAPVTAATAAAHGGVVALEVRRGEAAREALFEPREPLRQHCEPVGIGQRRVERLAIDGGGHGNVGRVFHAALDLERGDPGREQRRQGRDGGEIGGRQDAMRLAAVCGGVGSGRGVDAGARAAARPAFGEPVAHAAGLAAAPAVAAAPRSHARQQAGARVAVAQGAVDERL